MRKEDVVGISSLSFSNTGNGIYLSSSSELQQISLSARHTVAAGGGRVEVERRDEEEGGEGDTDSQADRWEYINMKNQNTDDKVDYAELSQLIFNNDHRKAHRDNFRSK